jgi:Cu/Zn superoxide dismutase
MRWAFGLVAATAALLVSVVSAVDTYVAAFDTDDVRGTITFTQGQKTIDVDISSLSERLIGKALWHIHEFPARSSQTDCGAAVTGGHYDPSFMGMASDEEVGNLSGRHGSLALGSASFTDSIFAATTASDIVGRSIVVHLDNGADNPRVACATIGTTPAVALTSSPGTVTESHISFSLAPRIVQVPGATSSAIQFSVEYTGPAPAPADRDYFLVFFDNNCAAENRRVFYSLQGLSFTNNVSSYTLDTVDAVYFYGRSVGVVTLSPAGVLGEVLQCANFIAQSPATEPVRMLTGKTVRAAVNDAETFDGYIQFEAVSDTEVLIVAWINALSIELVQKGALWYIHEFAATSAANACEDGITGGHWDPTFKGMDNIEEVGNLSGRHGQLKVARRAFIDTTIGTDIFGPRGINGRSIVLHVSGADNQRAACATIGTAGYGFRATFDDSSLTMGVQPRLFQVPDSAAAYLQYSGISTVSAAMQVAVLDSTVCPSAGAKAVPLVNFGAFANATATIMDAPDVTLYHGRVLALLAADNTVFVCSALTITLPSEAPKTGRDYTQPKYTAFVSGASYGGSVSFQRVSDKEVLIYADITSPSTAQSGRLGWTINELPYYGAAAGCNATGSAWNPTFTTPALGALDARFAPLVPGVTRAFSDPLLLVTSNFAGLTLALRDASGSVVACGLIGDTPAVDFAVATLPSGRGRVIIRPFTGSDGVSQTVAFFLDMNSATNGRGFITQYGTESAGTLAGCTAAGRAWPVFFGEYFVELKNTISSFKLAFPVVTPVAHFIGRDAAIGSDMQTDGHEACAPFVYADPTKPFATLTPTSLRTAVAKPVLSSVHEGSETVAPNVTVIFEQPISSDAVRVYASVYDEAGNGDKLPWHVHVFPVPSSGDCAGTRGHLDTTFHNAAGVEEAGDLSARHGVFDLTNTDDNYNVFKVFEDTAISLDPSKINIIGRSVTLHLENGTRLSCGTILPEGSAEPVATAAVITGKSASDIVLRVEVLDPKVSGYAPSVFVKAVFENPTALAATCALGFHTYAASTVGAGNAQCGYSVTGPTVAHGDLLSLLGKSVSFAAGDVEAKTVQAAAVSSKLDIAFLDGRSIVLRTSTSAQACVKFGTAAGTTAPAGTPADKIAHIIRLDFTDTTATSNAGLAYLSGNVLSRLTSFIASQFTADYDKFAVGSQSFFSKDDSVAAAGGHATLATVQYGNSVSLLAVPKTQSIDTAASQGSQLVQDMSSSIVSSLGDYVSSRYQFSGIHQVGVQSVSGYCQNGVTDNGETGPDCGNSAVTTCSRCEVGVACSVDSDCSSNRCSSGKCVSGSNSASTTTLSVASALIVLLSCMMFI